VNGGWVVVGLSRPCQDDEDLDCVCWVHGPFPSSREAREYAGKMPEGFRPHIMPVEPRWVTRERPAAFLGRPG